MISRAISRFGLTHFGGWWQTRCLFKLCRQSMFVNNKLLL